MYMREPGHDRRDRLENGTKVKLQIRPKVQIPQIINISLLQYYSPYMNLIERLLIKEIYDLIL